MWRRLSTAEGGHEEQQGGCWGVRLGGQQGPGGCQGAWAVLTLLAVLGDGGLVQEKDHSVAQRAGLQSRRLGRSSCWSPAEGKPQEERKGACGEWCAVGVPTTPPCWGLPLENVQLMQTACLCPPVRASCWSTTSPTRSPSTTSRTGFGTLRR